MAVSALNITPAKAFRPKMATVWPHLWTGADANSVFSTHIARGGSGTFDAECVVGGSPVSRRCRAHFRGQAHRAASPLKLDPKPRETFCPSKGVHHFFISLPP